MPDPQIAVDLSKTEVAAIGGGMLAAGGVIGKALETIWSRISARDTQNTAELVQLTKDTNKAIGELSLAIAKSGESHAVAITEMSSTLSSKIDTLIRVIPKRDEDKPLTA